MIAPAWARDLGGLCPSCGKGFVVLVGKPGRTIRYHRQGRDIPVSIPHTLLLPTCTNCREEFIGLREAQALDTVLDFYEAQLLADEAPTPVPAPVMAKCGRCGFPGCDSSCEG